MFWNLFLSQRGEAGCKIDKFSRIFTFTGWSLFCVPGIHFCKYTVHSGCCNCQCALCYISNPGYNLSHASRVHTGSDICLPQSRARSDNYHLRGHSYLHFCNHTVGYNLRRNLPDILNILLVKLSSIENLVWEINKKCSCISLFLPQGDKLFERFRERENETKKKSENDKTIAIIAKL